MTEPRTHSRVNQGRSPAAIVLLGLLGLGGLVWMVWPKPPAVEQLEASAAGSVWRIEGEAGRAILSGSTMGTSFSVIVSGEDFESSELADLQAAIDAELQAVNDEMSTYLVDSELSRFNRAAPDVWVPVSAPLFEVVDQAKQVSALSDHTFDVTVGPLVDAWGFGPADPSERHELDDAAIAKLRAVVGDQHLEVDRNASALRKRVAGLRVDLSAIAKGHGCDRVASVLDAASYTDYMVEIGGELRVRGSSPKGEPWKVGIERPTNDAAGARAVHSIVGIRDVGMATSGDYRNYWERDGVRYSHTIDPRTGRPITHTLASVTVIHPESAALADAWATALNVLGPDAGLARAEALGLAAYFLVRTPDGFAARSTRAFEDFLATEL